MPQNESEKGKTAVKIIAILAFSTVLTFALLRDRIVNPPFNQINVNGQGKVSFVPDRATINVGVQIDRAANAETALRELSGRMQKITDALKKAGAEEKNIQTQNYSIYPQYDYTNGTSVLNGYTANQTLSVKLSQVQANPNLVSDMISVATKSGANQILGVTYDLEDLESYKQEARLKAIADAQAKSKSIAQALNVKLGRIINWYENAVSIPGSPYPYYGDKGGVGMGGGGGPVPSGTQDIVIEVGITYKIK